MWVFVIVNPLWRLTDSPANDTHSKSSLNDSDVKFDVGLTIVQSFLQPLYVEFLSMSAAVLLGLWMTTMRRQVSFAETVNDPNGHDGEEQIVYSETVVATIYAHREDDDDSEDRSPLLLSHDEQSSFINPINQQQEQQQQQQQQESPHDEYEKNQTILSSLYFLVLSQFYTSHHAPYYLQYRSSSIQRYQYLCNCCETLSRAFLSCL